MVPLDPQRDDQLFETALRGHSLEEPSIPGLAMETLVADFDAEKAGAIPARKAGDRTDEFSKRSATLLAGTVVADPKATELALGDHPAFGAQFAGIRH
jgi:hypothetical protein